MCVYIFETFNEFFLNATFSVYKLQNLIPFGHFAISKTKRTLWFKFRFLKHLLKLKCDIHILTQNNLMKQKIPKLQNFIFFVHEESIILKWMKLCSSKSMQVLCLVTWVSTVLFWPKLKMDRNIWFLHNLKLKLIAFSVQFYRVQSVFTEISNTYVVSQKMSASLFLFVPE